MFDSPENINGFPVTNFLVRVMLASIFSTTTYNLTSLFSSTQKAQADYYFDAVRKLIDNWSLIERIFGVVTDNNASMKNASERLINSLPFFLL